MLIPFYLTHLVRYLPYFWLSRLSKAPKISELFGRGAATIALICLLLSVSLTGARGPVVIIILTIFIALFLKKGVPIRPLAIVLAAIVILSLPTMVTIFREGLELNISLFFQYLISATMERIFVGPMISGLYYVHYAQTVGFFGIAGIPKLAVLFGVAPVNAPNITAVYYGPSLLSGHNNACYVLTYYSYFGTIFLVFSLIGLWLLDFAVLVYSRLNDSWLLPCIASVSVASISFVSADYSVSLLTGGFGVLLIGSLIFDRICRIRMSGVATK